MLPHRPACVALDQCIQVIGMYMQLPGKFSCRLNPDRRIRCLNLEGGFEEREEFVYMTIGFRNLCRGNDLSGSLRFQQYHLKMKQYRLLFVFMITPFFIKHDRKMVVNGC